MILILAPRKFFIIQGYDVTYDNLYKGVFEFTVYAYFFLDLDEEPHYDIIY